LVREEGKIPYNFFLPRHLGGLGFTPQVNDLSELLDAMPIWHKQVLKHMFDNPEDSTIGQKLAQWSETRLSERGLQVVDIVKSDIFQLLQEFLPTVTVNQAYADVSVQSPIPGGQYPRYWDAYNWVVSHGYLDLRVALKSTAAIPFWDARVGTHRGWPGRSFSERNEILRKHFEGLLCPSVDEKELAVLLDRNPRHEIPCLVRREYAMIGIPSDIGIDVQSLNLEGKSLGASVFLGLRNSDLLGFKFQLGGRKREPNRVVKQ
jgi:hypothetical protein